MIGHRGRDPLMPPKFVIMKKFLPVLFSAAILCGCQGIDLFSGSDPQQEEDNAEDVKGTLDQAGSGEGGGYTLVWADYFDGDVLDMSSWSVEVNGNGGGNNELQYYSDANVTVDDGCLVLTAKREESHGKHFTSGRLNTKGKRFFTYGKMESSILIPKTANGLWPAFWLLGNDIDSNPWPRCGEIDILEMGNSAGIRNGTQDRFFNGACHWGFYKEVSPGGWAYPNYAKSTTSSYSLQDGSFHLFTMVWDEASIKMYLDLDKYPDAAPYYEMGITETEDEWATGRYFHHDFFIVYDLAVGGNFPGIWDASGITAVGAEPVSMYIDFVKVYQKK